MRQADILWFETLDSTSEEARRRAEAGARGPLWIAARTQTAGRGRRGRAWSSPPGNLAATLLLAPGCDAASAARLSFVAALAVHELIGMQAGGTRAQVKWPNDVLLDGAKVAGILLEASGPSERPDWLTVGIGINLASYPDDTPFPAISVAGAGRVPPSPETALDHLAANWARWFALWSHAGFAPIRAAWLERAAGLGRLIEARLPNTTLTGRFEGLDSDGALMLVQADGTQRSIAAGEVFFPPDGGKS